MLLDFWGEDAEEIIDESNACLHVELDKVALGLSAEAAVVATLEAAPADASAACAAATTLDAKAESAVLLDLEAVSCLG